MDLKPIHAKTWRLNKTLSLLRTLSLQSDHNMLTPRNELVLKNVLQGLFSSKDHVTFSFFFFFFTIFISIYWVHCLPAVPPTSPVALGSHSETLSPDHAIFSYTKRDNRLMIKGNLQAKPGIGYNSIRNMRKEEICIGSTTIFFFLMHYVKTLSLIGESLLSKYFQYLGDSHLATLSLPWLGV